MEPLFITKIISSVLNAITDSKTMVPFASAGFGAFSGVYLAYRLRRTEDAEQKHKEKLFIAERMLLKLGRQLNLLIQYKRDVLEQFENNDMRHIIMTAANVGDRADCLLRMSDVSFLNDSGNFELAFNLLLESDRFSNCLDLIDERTHFHLKELQPRLSELQTANAFISNEELRVALGPFLDGAAKTYTDQLFDHVYGSIESLPDATDGLLRELKVLYPGHKFHYAKFSEQE